MCEVDPQLVTRRPSQVRLGPPPPRMASPTTSRLTGIPRLRTARRPHGRMSSDALPLLPSPPSSQSPAALSSSSSPASRLCSPPPVAAQAAHGESGHYAPCTGTRVAGGEQNVPASASEPAPASAFVPAPAADHVQSRQGGQVERTCRSDCRRSPPSATAAAADSFVVEVHERCIQGDGPWDDDAHLLSAAANST
jgi:hypothetical protein